MVVETPMRVAYAGGAAARPFETHFNALNEDLKLRGQGDLFGIRQSGVLDFKVADVFQDAKLLQNASEEADRLLQDDPELEFPEHRRLKEHLRIKLNEIMLETTL